MYKRNMIFCENTALGLVKDKKLQLFEKRLFVPRNDFAKNEGHFAKKMRTIQFLYYEIVRLAFFS